MRPFHRKRRAVEAEIKMPVGDAWEHQKVSATFHCWGYREIKTVDRKKTGNMETVAIVELADGRIRQVLPERMRFLEPEVVGA